MSNPCGVLLLLHVGLLLRNSVIAAPQPATSDQPVFDADEEFNPDHYPPGFWDPVVTDPTTRDIPEVPSRRPASGNGSRRRPSRSRSRQPGSHPRHASPLPTEVAPQHIPEHLVPRQLSHTEASLLGLRPLHLPQPQHAPRQQQQQQQRGPNGETTWDLARSATASGVNASVYTAKLLTRGATWAATGAMNPELRRALSATTSAIAKIGSHVVPKVASAVNHIVSNKVVPALGVAARHAWPVTKAAYHAVQPHVVPVAKTAWATSKELARLGTELGRMGKDVMLKPGYNHVVLPVAKGLARHVLTWREWNGHGQPEDRTGTGPAEVHHPVHPGPIGTGPAAGTGSVAGHEPKKAPDHGVRSGFTVTDPVARTIPQGIETTESRNVVEPAHSGPWTGPGNENWPKNAHGKSDMPGTGTVPPRSVNPEPEPMPTGNDQQGGWQYKYDIGGDGGHGSGYGNAGDGIRHRSTGGGGGGNRIINNENGHGNQDDDAGYGSSIQDYGYGYDFDYETEEDEEEGEEDHNHDLQRKKRNRRR